MNAIKIKRIISEDIIIIDELKQFKGKTVNIIILPDNFTEVKSILSEKIPGWIGKYSGNGNMDDSRSSIYQ